MKEVSLHLWVLFLSLGCINAPEFQTLSILKYLSELE